TTNRLRLTAIYKLLKNGDVYKLEGTIKAVEDAGVFTCKAANKAGEDSRKATLKIADFAPKVTEKLPSSINLTEGEPLNLKAKISGKPVPKSNAEQPHLYPLTELQELNIANMTHDDAGVYKVVATNDKGQTASETSVGVDFVPKTTKPFVGQLHAVDAVVKKPIILEAKVTGNPQPKVQWFKDDNKLESGPHIKLSEGDNKATLTIEEAKLEDAGEYKLVVTNDQGEDSSSATVKVTEPGKNPPL
ncbi:ig-like domain-containing protein, partial [Caerostris extrusa]